MNQPGKKRKMPIGISVAVITLALVAWSLSYIDDWNRDLTTNTARLDRSAGDVDLRPLETDVPPAELAAAIERWVASSPRWGIASESAGTSPTSPATSAESAGSSPATSVESAGSSPATSAESAGSSPTSSAESALADRVHDPIAVHLVRRTPLMRFVDDIYVTITPTDTGSQLDARSASRVGKGDLGQNPRNLKELVRAMRTQVGSLNANADVR